MSRLYIRQTTYPKTALGDAQGKVFKDRQKVSLYFSPPTATKTLITQSDASPEHFIFSPPASGCVAIKFWPIHLLGYRSEIIKFLVDC